MGVFIVDDEKARFSKLTPAHIYQGQRDFGQVLEEIDRGIIIPNTGQEYPVVFENIEDDITTLSNPFDRRF